MFLRTFLCSWVVSGGRHYPDIRHTNFGFSVLAAYSGAQDFVLALLPWTLVWNLQMKKKEKVGIAFAMSLGVL
jgi:hypothetical protein